METRRAGHQRTMYPGWHAAAAFVFVLVACGCDGPGPEASQAPTAEDPSPLRPSNESTFDSSEHADLSELLNIVAGFFLPDTGLALVERGEIHLVDLSSGGTRVVGRKGEGPREFGHIGRATRTPQGILVWDVSRRRVALIAHDGEFLRSEGYAHAPLQDFMSAYPVAVHPDGRIIFRDGIYRRTRDYDGRTWNPATYVAVQDGDELPIVAQAKGDEAYYGARRSGSVVFGHRTFEAASEDRLIIAETDRGSIAVLDWSGREVAKIPMPAGVRLSAAQEMGRQVLVSTWERFEELLKRAAASGEVPYTPGDQVGASHPDFKDWPINEVAPPVDTLLTDFDGRLWARDYRLPDQDSVTWRVWDIDRAQLLFTARMDGEDVLLDARGDLVLLRRVDEFDVPRAVISQLRAAPGHS